MRDITPDVWKQTVADTATERYTPDRRLAFTA